MKTLRKMTLGLLLGATLLSASTAAFAEPPEYRKLRNSGAAGRWEAEQYRRADRMDRRGEHKKAQEVRDWAYERNRRGREAAKRYKDWMGQRAVGW